MTLTTPTAEGTPGERTLSLREVKQAEDRMQRALSGLLATQPFFGIAAMHITPPTRRQDITSIASDGLQLYYNPRWVIEASGNEIFHAVAHCVTACALKHHVRRGDRTSRRWQTASRQVTQHILLAHGLANPEHGPGLDLSVTQAYNALPQDPPPQPSPQRTPPPETGDNSSSGGDEQQTGRDPSGTGDQQGESGAGTPEQDDRQQSQNDEHSGSQQPPPPGAQGGQPEAGGGTTPPSGTDTGPSRPHQSAADGQNQPGNPNQPCDQNQPESQNRPETQKQPDSQNQPDGKDQQPEQPPDPMAARGDVLDYPEQTAEGEDTPDPWNEESRWDDISHQAMTMAQGQGNAPGNLKEIIARSHAPTIDWRSALREFMDDFADDRRTWGRPDRRHLSLGLYLPGPEAGSIETICFAVDTSASLDRKDLARAWNEIREAAEVIVPDEVRVIQCDARVQDDTTYQGTDLPAELEAKGRRGTRYNPVFQLLEEQNPMFLLYLTDLDCTDRPPAPDYPVLWICTDPQTSRQPPFGDRLDITPER